MRCVPLYNHTGSVSAAAARTITGPRTWEPLITEVTRRSLWLASENHIISHQSRAYDFQKWWSCVYYFAATYFSVCCDGNNNKKRITPFNRKLLLIQSVYVYSIHYTHTHTETHTVLNKCYLNVISILEIFRKLVIYLANITNRNDWIHRFYIQNMRLLWGVRN